MKNVAGFYIAESVLRRVRGLHQTSMRRLTFVESILFAGMKVLENIVNK
jgi:hypothetical protein